MATRHEIWSFCADMWAKHLMENWDCITIGGQTIDAKYGVTRDTCSKDKVGFAPHSVNLFELLSKQFSITGSEAAAASGWGLMNIPPTNPFRAFNFFNGRLVFPYPGRDGSPIYFSGRVTDQTPEDDYFRDSKFVHMAMTAAGITEKPLYLLPEPNAPNFLVEGSMHALRLRQEGFAGVASGGSKLNKSQIDLLAHIKDLYRIPDVDVLAPTTGGMVESKGAKIYHTGQTREQKIENLLPELRKIPQCKLIRYPSDFEQKHPKGDQNDWWQDHPAANEFAILMDQAVNLETLEILSFPTNLSAAERSERIMKQWLPSVAQKSPMEYADALEKLKKHLHLPTDQVTFLKREIKKHRDKGAVPTESTVDFSATSNFKKIYPGMDYVNGKLWYTITVKTLVKRFENNEPIESINEQPYLINSDGEFFAATETELTRKRLYFPKGCLPDSIPPLWSDSPDTPYSIPNFLDNRDANIPNTADLFDDIRTYFHDHCYLAHEFYHDFFTLFTMTTYCTQLFNGLGYVNLNGTKGCGKSRVLEILQAMCFDPVGVSSQSESFVFRTVDNRSPVMFFDEAEQLYSLLKTKDQVNEVSLILNAGYRKGSFVGRCIGKDNTPYQFRTFCPKVIANTRGLYAMLQSRSIYVPMLRCPKNVELKSWDPNEDEPHTADIRNRLHCWALAHTPIIAKTNHRLATDLKPMLKLIGLRDRERELWAPIYCMALVVDELCGRPFKFDSTGESLFPNKFLTLTGHIIEAQGILTKKKMDLMTLDDQWPRLLGALRYMLASAAVPAHTIPSQPPERQDGWYSVSAVTKWLNTIQGLQWFPTKQGQQSLRPLLNKAEIVLKEDECRYQKPGEKSKPTYIRINQKRLDAVCNDQDVPDEIDIDFIETKEIAETKAQEEAF